MDRDHVARNEDARRQLAALVARLSDGQLAHPLAGDWTVAAVLAHLAFWDRFVLARWQQSLRDETAITPLDDGLLDLINAAGLEQWLAVPPRAAADSAVAAAEALDRLIESLPPGAVQDARDRGLRHVLDRSEHRREHLGELERALGR